MQTKLSSNPCFCISFFSFQVLHVNGCSNCKNVHSKENRRLLCRHPEALHEEEEEEEEQVGFFETF